MRERLAFVSSCFIPFSIKYKYYFRHAKALKWYLFAFGASHERMHQYARQSMGHGTMGKRKTRDQRLMPPMNFLLMNKRGEYQKYADRILRTEAELCKHATVVHLVEQHFTWSSKNSIVHTLKMLNCFWSWSDMERIYRLVVVITIAREGSPKDSLSAVSLRSLLGVYFYCLCSNNSRSAMNKAKAKGKHLWEKRESAAMSSWVGYVSISGDCILKPVWIWIAM